MKSMTGFGSAEAVGTRGNVHVEARSYNHRFLDIRLRVHRFYQPFESRIYLWARDRMARGRVDISVQLNPGSHVPAPYALNEPILKFYLGAQKRLQEEFGLPGRLDIPALFGLGELFTHPEDLQDVEEEWPVVRQTLAHAVEGLEAMQEREGTAIQEDLRGRILFLRSRLAGIRSVSDMLPDRVRERLRTRIEEMCGPEQVDQQRLAQEIVYYCDKMDITEEIVRLESHFEVCQKGLEDGSITGKRLEFLAQEILRELNTINSKSAQAEIIYGVVDMKIELEKIRENAQNLQ